MRHIPLAFLGALLTACAVGTETIPPSEAATAAVVVGHCAYVNAFSQGDECKEYVGDAWTAEGAATDCTAPGPGAAPGLFEAEVACDRTAILAECMVDPGTPEHTVLVFPGEYGDSCSGLELGCSFAGGEYVPAEPCGSAPIGGGLAANVFTPFERVCVDAVEGEPPGGSVDDQVCTWQAISGSTEEGRYFADYADCGVVVTQRPYWASTVTVSTSEDDPRLADPEWLAEYDWVTAQVEASACVCCHSNVEAPDGAPSGWFIEADPIWTDTLDADGMAMMAGWVDSSVFGAFDAEDNNGFSRELTGMPTTDPERMEAYFAMELFSRGFVEADFQETPPFGGPLFDQLVYEPTACDASIGVDSSGTLTWSGGDARYVYVMDVGSDNPGVPPNLDLPEGTLWRLDVSPTATPVSSGISYGEVPAGTSQRFPESGAPAPLQSGEDYTLYVLQDVYVPLTRCVFVAP